MRSKSSIPAIAATALVLTLSFTPAFASGNNDSSFSSWGDRYNDNGHGRDHPGGTTPGTIASVPEIDATNGFAALAAVSAALAFAWERRRKS